MKVPTIEWIKSSEEDLVSAKLLFEHGRYPHAIYFSCQALEKIIKAILIEKTDEYPEKSHRLDLLASKTQLEFDSEKSELLTKLSKDYGRVRYPDVVQADYGTKSKTQPVFDEAQELYIWIKQQLTP